MNDEMNRNATEAYEAILQMAYKYNEYNATFQRMIDNIDPQFLKNACSIIEGYSHFAAHVLYNYNLVFQSLNWAKIAEAIEPLFQIQQQMAAITKAIPIQEIVYANAKIREGIMNSLENISCDAAEKEQLKNIFQNEELLSCADDIIEEMDNTSNAETPLDNSSAANTQLEKFSLLKHGIDLETAVVFTYVLAFAVFVIYCIRTDSLTEDDFFAFWLYIFQLLVGGMDAIECFAAEYPHICDMATAIISELITEQLKETIRRDKEKAVE